MEADIVFLNGEVITADSTNSVVEAVAVKKNRIIGVGTNSEVRALIGEETNVIDLQGRSLLPGFIDSHMHAIDGGFASLAADATDKVETLEQLKAFVAEARTTRRGFCPCPLG